MMIDDSENLPQRIGARFDRAAPITGFPESFQRTTPASDGGKRSGSVSASGSPLSANSAPFDQPPADNTDATHDDGDAPCRPSRSSVMKLENILNAVSIGYDPRPWTRRHSESPVRAHFSALDPASPSSSTLGRSQSPDESTTVKKKKVKMHRCPECQKDFPRPSGLRTHMNMHTKEKPFNCTYPGCSRAFSVVSNAKRHMRTHGVGIANDDTENTPTPYIVGFEAPMVVPHLDANVTEPKSPVRLRWIPLATEERWATSNSPSSPYSDSSMRDIPPLQAPTLH